MNEQERMRLLAARDVIGSAATKALPELKESMSKLGSLPAEQQALILEIANPFISLLEEALKGVVLIGELLEETKGEAGHD